MCINTKERRGINQTIDKFREKIPDERKHESHPLYFAPTVPLTWNMSLSCRYLEKALMMLISTNESTGLWSLCLAKKAI